MNFVNVELPSHVGFGGLSSVSSMSTGNNSGSPTSVGGATTSGPSRSQQDFDETMGLARALSAAQTMTGTSSINNPATAAEARLFRVQEQRETLSFLRELKSDLASVDRAADPDLFNMISLKVQQLQRDLNQL